MSKNRECTKAMAAVETRLGNQRRTAVITRDEFEAIGNYIEKLEHDLVMETHTGCYVAECSVNYKEHVE